ncbi:RDH8 dehydrogenase, partial [Horornis vulcanius]|nr:RDH8 dehydrogenase [Horornis vulcanius]
VIATMRNVGRSGALAAAAGPALGRTLEIKQLDVCDEGSIRACLDSIPGRHVDILVSNAGVGMAGPLECQSLAAMQSLMDTNFFGLVRLVKEVLPDMKRRRGGHIVVISSIMGLQG